MPQDSSHPEDNPREILDLRGMFTIMGCDPPVFVTYDQIEDAVKHLRRAGQEVTGVCPVPDAHTVTRTKDAMGNGQNGVWVATTFRPPARLKPNDVFEELPINTLNRDIRLHRYCIRRLPTVLQETGASLKTMAIFVSGAYRGVNNETDGAIVRGGWAFTCKKGGLSNYSGALEKRGPGNDDPPPLRMDPTGVGRRATLRAAVAALTWQPWYREGWQRVVLVTDNGYLAQGATEELRYWADPGPARPPWKSGDAASQPPNRDLWWKLMELLGEYAQTGGCEVSFWQPGRNWTNPAGQAAMEACRLPWTEYYADTKNPML
ncbi:Ribonuclease H [Apiospora arundinis]|uniref:Ribonuclease H n=1 Tax=Apiospora arundinis TaxID=335852 RepID=A0ABR2HLG5_9PEZI